MLDFLRSEPLADQREEVVARCRVVTGMYISVPTNKLRTVEAILRDHNMHPIEGKLPLVGGNQLINIRDDQVAKNVFHRLKEAGIAPTFTSTN